MNLKVVRQLFKCEGQSLTCTVTKVRNKHCNDIANFSGKSSLNNKALGVNYRRLMNMFGERDITLLTTLTPLTLTLTLSFKQIRDNKIC